MIVTVYHHDIRNPEALEAVAAVEAGTLETLQALEFAWERTQNLNGSWSRGPRHADGSRNADYHPAIRVLRPLHVENGEVYGLRSSMMGDVFELGGERYRVATIGFDEL